MDTTVPIQRDGGQRDGEQRDVGAGLSAVTRLAPGSASPAVQVVSRAPDGAGIATILLVDDDEVDLRAARRAFTTLRITNPLVTARDGREALDLLRGKNGRARLASPYLVLLDLNMPRMGGVEFLTELRDDPELCQTVVFVMTNSAAAGDRTLAYQKNIAGYVLKQELDRSFVDAIALLHHYWSMVQLPD